MIRRPRRGLAALLGLLAAPAAADPCGMVPPIARAGPAPTIARIGIQRTYVAHRNGIETIALRPAFEGTAEDFGMLIPFPSPPAIRKIDDDTFAHLEGALQPPQIVLDIRKIDPQLSGLGGGGVADGLGGLGTRGRGSGQSGYGGAPNGLGYNEVRLVREEAIGMYQVAVLEAGSPAALSRWMGENDYRYPEGMDDVTAEYVAKGWCFVAVKARVGSAGGVEPSPGVRAVDPQRPPGSTFSGHVQGMAFRFPSETPVVPMRLSVFNGESPFNVIYMLSERPLTVRGLDEGDLSVEVAHIEGPELLDNVRDPLALDIQSGAMSWLSADTREKIDQKRSPGPYVRAAGELFAADLLAMRTGELSLDHEERDKELLNISEALGLRGPEIDALHADAVRAARMIAADGALDDLAEMHMTVISGVLPDPLLRDDDLTFVPLGTPNIALAERDDPLQPPDITGSALVYPSAPDRLTWATPRPGMVGPVPFRILQQSGPLSQRELTLVVRHRMGAIRYCYQRELNRQPSLSGQVVVRIQIDEAGVVRESTVLRDIGGSAVGACVNSRFVRMKFPAQGSPTQAVLMFRFNPNQ